MVEGHRGDFLLSLIGQEVGALSGSVVGHHVVDGSTVDGVDVPFADVIHQVLKPSQDNQGERLRSEHYNVRPEAPEDLAGKVGGPGLGRVPRGLDHRVQRDDHLEAGVQQVLGRHLPEGTLLVDDVDDRHRPQQESSVLRPVQLCSNLQQTVNNNNNNSNKTLILQGAPAGSGRCSLPPP